MHYIKAWTLLQVNSISVNEGRLSCPPLALLCHTKKETHRSRHSHQKQHSPPLSRLNRHNVLSPTCLYIIAPIYPSLLHLPVFSLSIYLQSVYLYLVYLSIGLDSSCCRRRPREDEDAGGVSTRCVGVCLCLSVRRTSLCLHTRAGRAGICYWERSSSMERE